MGYIYLTTNLVNNRKYIGKQLDENKKNYLGSGIALKNAIKKYGTENFDKKIIHNNITNKKELSKLEKEYILKHNAQNSTEYYNIAPGGDGGCIIKNYKFTEEQKENCKKAAIIRNQNPEYLNKLSIAHKGKKLSEQHKQKLSESHKNQKNLNLAKAVIQYDLNYNFIKEHVSLSEACRYIGINPKSSGQLIKSCKNPLKYSAYKFRWRYK